VKCGNENGAFWLWLIYTPLILINLTPLKHPEKSVIFQGTRLIPLPKW